MQIAINGHLSQSTGDDFCGQQGISPCMLIDVVITCIAATAESGAVTRPAIRKIASSRERRNEFFTEPV